MAVEGRRSSGDGGFWLLFRECAGWQEAAIAASQQAFYKDDVARLQSRAASASLPLTGVMARDEFTVGARP